MKTRLVVCFLALLIFSLNRVDGQAANTTTHAIGFVQGGATPASLVDAFRQGLRDLGYIEGRSIVIEYRRAYGRTDQLPALVAELIEQKIDLIFTANTPAALAAKKASASTL